MVPGSGIMGKNILIVDDSAFMRAYIKKILAGKGYNIIGEASTGSEALDKYKKLRPNVVTMDLNMPGMSGIDGIRAIRLSDPEANIIMITSMGQKEMVVDAIKAGARDFIVKPFREEQVVQAVERILEK